MVMLTNQRLDATQVICQQIEEKAKATEAKAKEAKVNVASTGMQAIEEFKGSKDFRNEIKEVTYDAFLKGFVESKGKVIEAFADLDLKGIIAEEPKDQEEEEVEVEVVEGASLVKIEEVDIKKTKEGMAFKVIEEVEVTPPRRLRLVRLRWLPKKPRSVLPWRP